jgi:hypothetical protein
MSKLPADIRISLKKPYWVRDGKYSAKMSEAPANQIATRIRHWLVANR